MLAARASSRFLGVSYHSRKRLGTWYSSPRCFKDAPELQRESDAAVRGSWSEGGGGGDEGGGGRLVAEPNSSPPSRLPEVEDRLPEWDRWLLAEIPIPLSRELCRPLSWRPRRCVWAEEDEEVKEEEGEGRPPKLPVAAGQSRSSSKPLRAFSVDELDAVSLERCSGLANGSAQNSSRPP